MANSQYEKEILRKQCEPDGVIVPRVKPELIYRGRSGGGPISTDCLFRDDVLIGLRKRSATFSQSPSTKF